MTSKKVLAIILSLIMILSLAACSGGSSEPAAEPAESGETESVRIGILQFAPHASLDNCYSGIMRRTRASRSSSPRSPAPRAQAS